MNRKNSSFSTQKRKSLFKGSQRVVLMSLFCGITALFMACNPVHQFPEDIGPVDKKVKIPLKLTYQPDFYIWNHDYDPKLGRIEEKNPEADIYPGYPGTTSKYSNIAPEGVLDVHVKVYNSSGSQLIAEEYFTKNLKGDSYDQEIELLLEADKSYNVAVWSHLRENEDANAYYNPSNFNSVGLVPSNYNGNTDYRDGFSGTLKIDTSNMDETNPHVIFMTRPMGKFELITVDLSEFLDRETTRRGLATRAKAEEYHVQISFPMFYPSSYSVIDDRLVDASSGVSFMTHMSVNGETEASLGFEYVLLNNISDGAVQMKVDIYDPSYQHVAGSTTLTVPMRRDCHTILKGAFLSTESDGGVGIDPGFNGDHNITV